MSVIGIDFDGTLAKHATFEAPDIIPKPDPYFVNIVKHLWVKGHILCTWTCRADYIVDAWLSKYQLRSYFSYINKSPLVTDSMKPNFDVYIGDEVVYWNNDRDDALADIVELLRRRTHKGFVDIDRDHDFMDSAPVPFYAGTGRGYIDMFEGKWQALWTDECACGKDIALLTICSHAKPYSKSFIHSTIRCALYDVGVLDQTLYAHISTAGIIPSGGEMVYPFNAYDHDGTRMTEAAKKHFSEVTRRRIGYWLKMYSHNFERIIFYLRGEGKTYNAAKQAVEDASASNAMIVGANMHIPPLPWVALPDVDDCLTSSENLTRLLHAYK